VRPAISTKSWVLRHTPAIPEIREEKLHRRITVQAGLGKKPGLTSKITKYKAVLLLQIKDKEMYYHRSKHFKKLLKDRKQIRACICV
jgi:hypothetical protein